jgi:PAS domain S-box-containing protein
VASRSPTVDQLSRPVILLADDNDDVREYLRCLLGREYEVVATANGEAAISAAREQTFDLVLTDVVMPRLDGFDLLKALRSDGRTQGIPVILFSARADDESRVRGLNAGADDYLVKPFSARELLACVGAHLKLARLRRKAAEIERELRRQADQHALEAEEQQRVLDTLLASVPEGITLVGGPPDFPIIANSRVAERLVGRPAETLLGLPVGEHVEVYGIFHADGVTRPRPEQMPLYRATRHGETITDEEWVIERPDQTRIIIWVNVAPIRDSDGQIVGAVNCWRDITEHRRAEDALRRAAEMDAFRVKLNDALRTLADPVAIQAEACRLLGERLGVDRAYYVEISEPDDYVRVGQNYVRGDSPSLVGVCLLSSYGWTVPLRRGEAVIVANTENSELVPEADRKALTSFKVIAIAAVPLLKEGVLVGALAVTERGPREWEDTEIKLTQETAERTWAAIERARAEAALREAEVTYRSRLEQEVTARTAELRESREQYSSLVENTPDVITRWNRELKLIYANKAFEAKSGALNQTLYGKNNREMGQPDEIALPWIESLQKVFRTGEAVEHYNSFPMPDGEAHFYSRIVPEKNDNGEVETVLAIARDITDLRNADQSVKKLLKQLITIQEEERRRIARNIHDQMGQQMTALRLSLSSLTAGRDGQDGLIEQARRMQALAEDLDQSIDFLTWELRPAALEHLGLAKALGDLVLGWSERYKVLADFHASGVDSLCLPPDAEINLYRLAQEALHNIFKHAGANMVSVILERRGDQIVLIVEDDGCGFDPVEVSAGQGGGLGLTSMRERATLVGGKMQVESSLNNGTTIFVYIPLPQPGKAGLEI